MPILIRREPDPGHAAESEYLASAFPPVGIEVERPDELPRGIAIGVLAMAAGQIIIEALPLAPGRLNPCGQAVDQVERKAAGRPTRTRVKERVRERVVSHVVPFAFGAPFQIAAQAIVRVEGDRVVPEELRAIDRLREFVGCMEYVRDVEHRSSPLGCLGLLVSALESSTEILEIYVPPHQRPLPLISGFTRPRVWS